MTGNKRQTIIITMGDPAGIGPEIAVKALSNPTLYSFCRPLIVGDFNLLQKTAKQLKLTQKFRRLTSPRNAKGDIGIIDVIDLKNVDMKTLKIGRISAEAGRASLDYVEKAVAYALRGDAHAIVTAPINKKAIQQAGSRHIGHTELIAALSGVNEPLTMFWVRGARIFFLTRHLPLKEALKAVRKERLMDAIIHVDGALKRIGIINPRLAVAALNPHASDGGLIGEEEEHEIIPAIQAVRARGVNACGPIPADSVFHHAVEGRYDAVLSLYHDQGHIAAKTLDFYGTVSVTLELPFVRTSVDHGTAHEIAGKGIANSKSLEEAVTLASRLLSGRYLAS